MPKTVGSLTAVKGKPGPAFFHLKLGLTGSDYKSPKHRLRRPAKYPSRSF